MFSAIRALARPLSVLALLALAVPASVVPCDAAAASAEDVMPCCVKIKAAPVDSSLNADCCQIQQEAPSRPLSEAPAIAARSIYAAGQPTVVSMLNDALPPSHPTLALAPDAGPPSVRLYLRLSVIRR